MEARRKTANSEVNYLKPRKNNQFSPSPIKRYHKGSQSNQTNTQSSTKAFQTKQQSKVHQANEIEPNFKENESLFHQVTQKLLSKRPMRVLRSIENELKCPNNSKEVKQIFPHYQLLKQDSSDLPQQICNQQSSQTVLFKTPSPNEFKNEERGLKSQETRPSTQRKRDAKLTRKQIEVEIEEEKKQLDPSLDIPLLQEDSSRMGYHPQLINNLKRTNQDSMIFSHQESYFNQLDPNLSQYQAAVSSEGQVDSNGMQYQGRWTEEEHQKFLDGLKMFGKDWRSIEEHIGSRTCAQIRSHAQKYFNKLNRDKSKGHASILQESSQITHQLHMQSQSSQKTVKKTLTVRPPELELVHKPIPIQTVQKPTTGPVTGRNLMWHTNQQISQILLSLQRHQQEDFVVRMKSLIAEREYISKLYLIDHTITESEAVQRLIPIADQFDLLSKEVLLTKQIDLCNRMIDERNLSQLACITLSSKIAVLPNPDQKRQIITHVYHSTGPQTEEEHSEKQPGTMMAESESHNVKALPDSLTSQSLLQNKGECRQ